jgi:Dimethyladenosine transferase (rRNA methylation)
MPSLEWNKETWNKNYSWEKGGAEWSEAWGESPAAQWVSTILPRINSFLPCNSILEIAPGFGRWTEFLLTYCNNYTGIDLSQRCIDHCKSIFNKGNFFTNDGCSLSDAPDGAFDFVFSFDSLVHAERKVIESYLLQIAQKLSENGIAFLHLSNFQELPAGSPNLHCRDESVSATFVREFLAKNKIPLLVQEQIGWGGDLLVDQFILIAKKGPIGQSTIIESPHFMQEATLATNVFQHYVDPFDCKSFCKPRSSFWEKLIPAFLQKIKS